MKFLINPNRFNILSSLIIKPLFYICLISLFIGLFFSLFLSPNDYQQGASVRIMYVHVPSAWLSLLTFFIMTIYSIIALAFRMPFGFIVNKAVAPIGAVFTLICIISGSLWGKPMWGTWWVWDARLTSTLILFFIYAAMIGLHSSIDDKSKADRAVSILSIVGIAIIPIIKKSVDWWQTLHQPSTFTLTSAPSMTPDMYQPLLVCVLGFYLMFAMLLTMNLRAEVIVREKNKSWVSKQYLTENK